MSHDTQCQSNSTSYQFKPYEVKIYVIMLHGDQVWLFKEQLKIKYSGATVVFILYYIITFIGWAMPYNK